MREKLRIAYNIFAAKPHWQRSVGLPDHRQEDNIKINFKE
jgi:hypothetical protein